MPTQSDIAAREAEIQKLVEEDRREEAGKLLFELITACAQARDFANATRLRDMLYDVDPMALTSVIKANEIIDQAMSGAMDPDFTATWADLAQALSEDEFLALYHALRHHELDKGKVLVKAGAALDALFLVNAGRLNVICTAPDGKHFAVKILGPGEMIGENLFEPSFWTVSLATLEPVRISMLRAEALESLEERFAGFEDKLAGFASRFHDIPALLESQDLHRRRFARARCDHKMVFQVIDKHGRVDERAFKGELNDIGQGGLSFLLRIVKREKRRMLFGRRLRITVACQGGKHVFDGSVRAVTIQDFQARDYAMHVAFDQPVAEERIAPLLPVESEEEPPLDLVDDGSHDQGPGPEPTEEN